MVPKIKLKFVIILLLFVQVLAGFWPKKWLKKRQKIGAKNDEMFAEKHRIFVEKDDKF